MNKQEYNNIRNLVIDIHSDISPSNVVLYKDSIEDTILVCRLISNSYYYTIPENAKIRVSINDIEILEGQIPSKQQKMVLGWAAFHQSELLENWELAAAKQELFPIAPLH